MKKIILHQLRAALDMQRHCIEQYDDELWVDGDADIAPAWQIAYHNIFFANIYSAARGPDIVTWHGERADLEHLAKPAVAEEAFSQKEMLAFLHHVVDHLPVYVEHFDAEADCWPHWYQLNQLEFQCNNLRHIQHHLGQLLERHRGLRPLRVDWQRF